MNTRYSLTSDELLAVKKNIIAAERLLCGRSNHMNNPKRGRPYLEPLPDVGPYQVWLVDGAQIIKKRAENFVYSGQHRHFRFIPAHELWLDRAIKPGERHFFILRLLTELRLMAHGANYDQIEPQVNEIETRERRRALRQRVYPPTHLSTHQIIERIHKDLLQSLSNQHVKIWLVDGKAVRDYYCADYVAGGHDLFYDFIPSGEIWLEETLSPQERHFILVHELHERYLMGLGKDYPHAHLGATIIEDYYRDHPQELDQRLHEELGKQTLIKTLRRSCVI